MAQQHGGVAIARRRTTRMWIGAGVASVVLVGLVVALLVALWPGSSLTFGTPQLLDGTARAQRVSVRPDGGEVLVATMSEGTVILRGDTLAVAGRLDGLGAGDVVFTPDGGRAYTSSAVGIVPVNPVSHLIGDPVSDASVDRFVGVSADGRTLYALTSTFDGDLLAVDVENGGVRTLAGTLPGTPSVVLAPDGARAYLAQGGGVISIGSGEYDTALRVLDIATGAVTDAPGGAGVGSVVGAPDGRAVYALTYDRLLVIDPANGTVIRTINTGNVGENARVSPDGRFIVSMNLLEDTVEMRDLDDGRVTASVPYNDTLLDIALTPDGTRMLLAGLQGLTVVPIVVQQ